VHFSNSPEVFEAAERLFSEVASRIREMLPHAEIEHIGSTAVRGSLTKGDLDVLVRVSGDDFRESDCALEAIFRRNEGSDKRETFSAFLDSSTSPELGVQLVVAGTEFDTFSYWVEQLTSDRKLRAAYNDLKARYNGKDMNEYREAKSEFIAKHIR
jgi:GrpB-like predicted nucleotidyltransferase (UPF0157 family)